MVLFPKIPKYFGIISLCFILFASLTIQAQSSTRYYYDNVIRVKLEEPAVKNVSLSTAGGVVMSGISTVDLLNQQFNAVSMKRVFAEGGKFKERREAFGLHRWYEIRFSTDQAVPNLVTAYENDSNVEIAEPILRKKFGAEKSGDKKLEFVPNDPSFPDQYNWENTGQTGGTPGADVSAVQAWDVQSGDTTVVVSMHDSGYDTDHPDLIGQLWTNPNPDPDMNDLHGYNFADDNNNIYDSDGHGSHTSGTVAAVNDNGVGVSGLAGGDGSGNGVRIMVCKVFGDANVGGFAESYAYAADHGAVISQNSWGYTSQGYFEQAVLDGIDYFIANAGYDEVGDPVGPIHGGIVIFSAGNEGSSGEWYPAYYEPVYAVAGTNHFDRLIVNGVDGSWFGSNYGDWVDISAPGMFILSTVIDGYAEYSGTSMAAPHVSAAAGLVASQYPGLTNDEVMLRILGTTDPIDDLNPGYEGMLGTGRLNAYAALLEDDGQPPEAITDLTVTDFGQITVDLEWTVPDVTPAGASLMAPPALYDIRYSQDPINDLTDFENATQVDNPPTPFAPGELQSFTVEGLVPLTTYYFAIRSQDLFANKSDLSNVVSATTQGAPVLGTDPVELYAEVEVDNQEVQTLTLENVGEGTLEWSIPGYEALDILNNPAIQKNDVSSFPSLNLAKGEKDSRVGNPIILGAGGPDDFGYTWIDNNEPGGPIYNWYEISDIGTEVTELSGTWDGNTQITLPFDFKLYDNTYSTAYVSVNGWLYFGSSPSGWYSNQTIPNTDAPNNLLAIFWDDLDMRTEGTVYTYYDDVNNLFIVQWEAVPKSFDAGSLLTFQAILTPYGVVTYQYQSMVGTMSESTIGIENADGTDGLQVVFNAPYVEDGLAVKINTPRLEWLDVTPTSGSLAAGETDDVTVTYDATGLLAGIEYSGDLNIASNDPSKPTHPVPTAMMVTGGDPQVAVSPDTLDFGIIIQGTTETLPFTIYNVGTGAALAVSDITFSEPAFSVDQTSLAILPGDSAIVNVTFEAIDPQVYSGTMSIESNDTDDPTFDVVVMGEGGEAPIVSTTPSEFDVTQEAGTVGTEMMTIENTGGSDLEYSIEISKTGSSLNYSVPPSDGNFTHGIYETSMGARPATGSGIEEPNTPVASLQWLEEAVFYGVNYGDATNFVWFQGDTPDVLNIVAAYGGADFSNAADFPANDDSYVYELDSGGNLRTIDVATGDATLVGTVGADWSGMATDPTDGTIYVCTGTDLYTLDPDAVSTSLIGSFGVDFMIDIAIDGDGQMYGFSVSTDTFYEIDKSTGTATAVGSIGFDANYGQGLTWDSQHDQILMAAFNNTTFVGEFRIVDRTTGNTQLVGVLGDTSPGSVNQLGWIATPISTIPDWLTADVLEGVVAPGGSVDVELTFDATELIGNVEYYADLNISSNDPVTPDYLVPVTLTTTGTPEVVVTPTTLDFGDVFFGTTSELSFDVSNTGNAILNVTDVSIDNGAYTADASSFVVLPGEVRTVTVTFAPDAEGNFDATLTVANDDADVNVDLLGNGVPFITADPAEFNETLASGEMVTRQMTITNEYTDNLPFSIYIQGVEASVEPTFYPSDLTNIGLIKWFELNDRSNLTPKQKDPSTLSIKKAPEQPGVVPTGSNFPLSELMGATNVDAYAMDLWSYELVQFDAGVAEDVQSVASGFSTYAGNFAHGNMNDIFIIRDSDNMLVKYNIGDGTFTDVVTLTPENEDEGWTDLETDYTSGELYASTYLSGESTSKIYKVNRFTGEMELVASYPDYLLIAIAIDDVGTMFGHDILSDQLVRISTDTWALTEVGLTGFTANYAQGMTFDQTTRQLIMAAYNTEAPYGERNELRYVNKTTGMTTLIGKFYGDGSGEMGWMATRGEGFLSVNLLNGTLPPGVSLNLTVKFDASNLLAGEYDASIAIVGDGLQGEPSINIPTHLTVTGDPLLYTSTEGLTFEQVFENGTSEPQYVTIRNDGTDLMHVTGLSVDNTDFSFSEYSLADDTLFTLEPGEPRVFEFIFTPTSVGMIDGNFTVETDGGNATITLQGEGIPAPVLEMDITEMSHQAYPGQQQDYAVGMTNSGGNPLDYQIVVGTPEPAANGTVVALEEGFEGGTFPPDGWVNYSLGDANSWEQTSAYVHSGSYSAYHNDFFGDNDNWFVTPQLSLGDGALLHFFDYTNYASWYVYSGIWVSTGSADPNDGDYVELMEFDDGTSSWTERSIDLSAYAGSDVHIAFVYQGDFAHEWYIDDVLVSYEEQPWLSVASDSGTMGPGESGDMNLHVDATGLTAGVYESGLMIYTNDPMDPMHFLPFTLTVVEELTVSAYPAEGDETVNPNEEFIVPITVTSMNDLEVMSFQFTLEYDTELLEPMEIMTDGTLTEGTLLETNMGGGQVSVAAVYVPEGETTTKGSTPALFAIEGEGTMAYVKFKAQEVLGDSVFWFSDVLFNEGTPAAASSGGSYSVVPLYGDANLDVSVNAFDATTVLQHVVGIIELGDVAGIAANVSGDASITSFDASLILHYVAGLIDEFPVEATMAVTADNNNSRKQLAADGEELNSSEGKNQNTSSVTSISKASVALSKTSYDQTEKLMRLPIQLNEADKVYSVDLSLDYDAEVIDIDRVVAGLPDDWIMIYNDEDSHLNIAMAGITPLSSGEFSSILFKMLVPEEEAKLEGTAIVNESSPHPLDINVRALPFEFDLSQNYPNPFNPTTTIKYQLPEQAEVSLVIYNQLGQVVKHLVKEEKVAGYYKVKWNGTNNYGRQVASGVYLFRIQAGSFVDVKKMILLK